MTSNDSESRKRRRRTQLHKSKIKVDKSNRLLGATKLYKLMVEEEDGREVAVLQAASDKGSFPFWRKGTYCIYGQSSAEGDEPSSKSSSSSPSLGNRWELVGQISSPGWFYDRSVIYNENGNAKAVTMYSCTSRTGDLMRMEVALPPVHIERIPELTTIISTSSILPRDCASVVADFVGHLYWSEDFVNIDPTNCHLLFNKRNSDEDDSKTPSETREPSPAAFSNAMEAVAPGGDAEEEVSVGGSMSAPSTSIHDGFEHLHCEDCGKPKCSCVASTSSGSSSAVVELDQHGKVCTPSIEKIGESSLIYHNKVPVWNPGISAYTLEFCGRALLPSVHNFQLVNERGDVVLQLGKVRNSEFNMDFGHPLSAFQAFSICLSVIQRTFVWD